MPVTTDFRVFNVSPVFGGVASYSNETRIVTAKRDALGKPQKFSFLLLANFERCTANTSSPVKAQCEFRVFLDGVLVRECAATAIIPTGRMSANHEFGLTEVHFNKSDLHEMPKSLLFEFIADRRRIAAFELKVNV